MDSILVLALLCRVALAVPPQNDDLLVKTYCGTYRGVVNDSAPHVREFLGISYAKPPTGQLRWRAPQKLHGFGHSTYSATRYAPSCPQYTTSTPFIGNQVLPEITINGPVSEDCLALNIFTPTGAKDVPVLIFLPGGGFTTGGANVNYQWPGRWIERTQKHIVVSLNYRLNIFGFPNAAGLTEQNLGVLDQRAGLEWVRDNIHAFGGDASKITLMGQSAGGASADGHNLAYWQDPIYTGYFGMSGTVFIGALPKDDAHKNFTFVAEAVGCGNRAPADELECMRHMPHEAITAFMKWYSDASGLSQSNPLNFVPVPDEKIMFSNYSDRYAQGKVSNRPAIYSTCENEGASQVPYNAAGIGQALADQVTLGMFQCPAARSTHFRSALNLTTYRYLYSGNFSNVSPLSWLGAYHGSDVPMLFGTHGDYDNGRGPSTALEEETSEKMQDFLLAFMQNPRLVPEALGWGTISNQKLLRFGADGIALQVVAADLVDQNCSSG